MKNSTGGVEVLQALLNFNKGCREFSRGCSEITWGCNEFTWGCNAFTWGCRGFTGRVEILWLLELQQYIDYFSLYVQHSRICMVMDLPSSQSSGRGFTLLVALRVPTSVGNVVLPHHSCRSKCITRGLRPLVICTSMMQSWCSIFTHHSCISERKSLVAFGHL